MLNFRVVTPNNHSYYCARSHTHADRLMCTVWAHSQHDNNVNLLSFMNSCSLRNVDTKRSTEILSNDDELQSLLRTKLPAWSPPEGGARAGMERETREASSLIPAFWCLRRLRVGSRGDL